MQNDILEKLKIKNQPKVEKVMEYNIPRSEEDVKINTTIIDKTKEQDIDVLCLQETKTPDEFFPRDELEKIGFKHQYYRGEKSYNGVAIISKFEFTDTGYFNWCEKDDTRHIYIKLNIITRHT